MSTLTEDRLSAALAARAEQVQPEDLRPMEVPPPSHRRPSQQLVGLAAAACALAVLVPLALGGEDGDGQPPPADPSGPTTAPRPEVQARDVDGDGRLDDVWLETSDDRYAVMVRLADGNLVRSDGQAPTTAELMPEADLDRDGAADLVVRVSEDPSVMPAVYSWLAREGLVRAPFPDEALEGWRPNLPTNRWAVSGDGGLRTWENEPMPGDTRVPYWDWSLEEQVSLRPGVIQLGCVGGTGAVPELCDGPEESGKGDAGLGSRDDLPPLFPEVEERLATEPFLYDENPGSENYVQLRGDRDFTREGVVVEGAEVRLVAVVGGKEHRAALPAAGTTWLVPRILAAHGDMPVFVVQQSAGDTSASRVFAFRDDELVELVPEGDVFLGSGVVGYQGVMTEQRTWITSHGQMFTAVLVDHETRRQHLWRWDVGRAVSPTDLGEVCIDWATRDYGRCP